MFGFIPWRDREAAESLSQVHVAIFARKSAEERNMLMLDTVDKPC